MQRRRFGRTGLEVPALTFGGGWVGGLLIRGSEDERETVLNRALEAGIDWIDTAALYGNGVSETVIGALSASMVNSANLGIPIAAYVLGDAALAAPVLIFQLAIYTPIYVASLDSTTLAEARRRAAADSAPEHDAGRSPGPGEQAVA